MPFLCSCRGPPYPKSNPIIQRSHFYCYRTTCLCWNKFMVIGILPVEAWILCMSTQHILEESMPADSFSPLGTIFSDSELFLFWLMFHLWEGLAISSCSKPMPGVRSRIRWCSLFHCCDHGHLNCQQPREGKKALEFNHKCNRNGVKPVIVNFLRCVPVPLCHDLVLKGR